MQHVSRLPLLAFAVVLFVGGCGDGPEVVPVAGVVTHEGQPVPNLFLNFKPEQGRPSWAITDERGQFEVHYSRDQNGARVGVHKVWVRAVPGNPGDEMQQVIGSSPESRFSNVDPKYASEQGSPLTVKIAESTDSLHITLD